MKNKPLIPNKPIKQTFKRKKKNVRTYRLTKKRTAFCHEYVIDHNGLQAAIRAKFSPNTAGAIASQLLKNIYVQKLIAELEEKQHQKLDISAERILKEYARLAFFDPQKMFDADGRLIPIHKLDKDTAACIGGIDTYQKYVGQTKEACKEVTKKFKIWEKKPCLDMLAKRFPRVFGDQADESDEKPVSKRMFFKVVDASKSEDTEDE